MSRVDDARALVTVALGAHRIDPERKDDVIAYLAIADWTPDDREAMYRLWAFVTRTSVTRTDLDRARQARRRETNFELPF